MHRAALGGYEEVTSDPECGSIGSHSMQNALAPSRLLNTSNYRLLLINLFISSMV